MQKKSSPWGIILLITCLFFPIGIYMIVKKVTSEKFNYVQNGRTLKVLGWVLLGFAMLYLILGLTGNLQAEDGSMGGVISVIFIFGAGGLVCLYYGSVIMKRGLKYSRYVSIVVPGNNTYLDNIAAQYPTSYDKAVADLQAMIDAGYFMNSYIDLNRRELILPKVQAQPNYAFHQPPASTNAAYAGPRTIQCPNCGAPNTLFIGAVKECEYCGSLL